MASRLDNLKAQREAAGLTQSDLATHANVSVQLIVRLEALGSLPNAHGGTCMPNEAQQICDALGISLVTAGFQGL